MICELEWVSVVLIKMFFLSVCSKRMKNCLTCEVLIREKKIIGNRELKQTDAAAVNQQISIQKDSRPSEFSRPLTLFIF